jgi:hypothetical protein
MLRRIGCLWRRFGIWRRKRSCRNGMRRRSKNERKRRGSRSLKRQRKNTRGRRSW